MNGVYCSVCFSLTAVAAFALGAPSALAQAAPAGSGATVVLPTIDVFSITPLGGLSGTGVDVNKVPAAVTTIDSKEIEREESPSIVKSLAQSTPSVDVQDIAGNPFQPDVFFRGFDPSPVP